MPMAYKNNFPKMYIFTKCLQVKNEEKKKCKRVSPKTDNPHPLKHRTNMYDKKYNPSSFLSWI